MSKSTTQHAVSDMTRREQQTASENCFSDAFEALDDAAILFDTGWRCVATNGRYRRTFHATSAGPSAGYRFEDTMRLLFDGGGAAIMSGFDLPGMIDKSANAIRSYRRGFDVPMTDGRILIGSANPTPRGGCLVTFRDRHPEIMGELQALGLLGQAFESADMGMIILDASLTVQMANSAWSDLLGPVRSGMSGTEYATGLIRNGLLEVPTGQTVDEMVQALFAMAQQQTITIDGKTPDGRKLLMQSFRTPTGGIMGTAIDVTQLRSEEARINDALGEIVESLEEGVALYDADLRLRMSNEALHRLVHDGHPRMPHGTHMSEHCAYVYDIGQLALPEGVRVDDFTAQMKDATRSFARDMPMQRTDGRHLEFSSHPTPMGGYLIALRDVTERKRAEIAEREADARVRTIVESLGEGVALYDSERRLLMNNPAFRRLLMDDRDLSAPGTTLDDEVLACIRAGQISVPADKSEKDVMDWIRTCIEEGRIGVELSMADGRVLEASNFRSPDGGYVVAMRDITIRKRAEESTRETDTLVRTIVNASPATLMVSRVDDGRVIFAPRATLEQANGLDMTRDISDPEIRKRYLEALLPTGELRDWPVRFHRADGSAIDCLTSARVIEFRGERLIVFSSLDVTERLALQAELERQREVAHQNEKLLALGELLAGVAHELNNPLSIVVGHTMMLADEVDTPALKRRVDKISSAAQRSGRIVKMFLAMARQRPARVENCDLNELVRAALDISAYGLRAAGVKVTLDLDAGLPEIGVDSDQIAQVVSNLIMNAEQALAGCKNARLSIVTSASPETVEIRVADSGPGVPEALRSRVFEPFFTTKEVGVGTGVGLAFCHRIVTAHGGRLTLHNGPEGGAIFTVALPIRPGGESANDAPKTERQQRAHILVIDDEPEVGELLGEVLSQAGHRVTLCTDATQALEQCQRTKFDAILSDIKMPGMDGRAFLVALEEAAPRLVPRVAFLTGDSMGQDVDTFLTASGRPYAEKPLPPVEILALVDNLLEEAGR